MPGFRAIAASPLHPAHKWLPRSWSTGIYVLDTNDGSAYVGKATTVSIRINEHRQRWPNLRAVAFMPTSILSLAASEARVANALIAAGCKLHNLTFGEVLSARTQIDDLISPDEQRDWLAQRGYNHLSGPRGDFVDLRCRGQARFEKLMCLSHVDALLEGLRQVVEWVIPVPRRTELEYWSVTCRPGDRQYPDLRLNVGNQTLFDTWATDDSDRANFRLYVSIRLVCEVFGVSRNACGNHGAVVRLGRSGIQAEVEGSPLVAATPDAVNLLIAGPNNFARIMEDEAFVLQWRRLALGLMQKSKNINMRSHCVPVADAIFSPAR